MTRTKKPPTIPKSWKCEECGGKGPLHRANTLAVCAECHQPKKASRHE